ncbi:hypothetical protein MTO96_018748 [Rhipicephalus appendiculatus]
MEAPGGRGRFIPSFLVFKQLYVLLWKNVYIKRLLRHYTSTLIEIAFIVALLSGIQEDSVTREPLVRRPDTLYKPIRSDAFWNTQPDLANITKVMYYPARNRYLNRLTRDAFRKLGVTHVTGLDTLQQLEALTYTEGLANEKAASGPLRGAPLPGRGLQRHRHRARQPAGLVHGQGHAFRRAGELPAATDLSAGGTRGRGAVPGDAHAASESWALCSSATWNCRPSGCASRRRKTCTCGRFPFPAYIEHHDQKNYALVLTRFCIGMLIPFTVLVARLTDEKASGEVCMR